jgi:hypothetical protein
MWAKEKQGNNLDYGETFVSTLFVSFNDKSLPHGILIDFFQIKFKSIFKYVGWTRYLPTHLG